MFIRSVSLFLYSGLALAGAASAFPVLTYSTYLRDGFTPKAIATDSSGNIYMAGNAIVDPVRSQTTVLVVKLNPQASQYLYVRYLGGSVSDSANAIAVDSAGDAYVAGSTAVAGFSRHHAAAIWGGAHGSVRPAILCGQTRSQRQLVFSDLLGGPAASAAQAVAVNAAGQILVSGTVSVASGLPFDRRRLQRRQHRISSLFARARPYRHEDRLLRDRNRRQCHCARLVGQHLCGGHYLFCSTIRPRPALIRPRFPVFHTCTVALCMSAFQGPNQYRNQGRPHRLKVDLLDRRVRHREHDQRRPGRGCCGQRLSYWVCGSGLPVHGYSPTAPLGPALAALATPALPFLSKLDPAGQTLLFSVPVGGAGVQVDSNGSAYVGGGARPDRRTTMFRRASRRWRAFPPSVCCPTVTNGKSAYVSQVDPPRAMCWDRSSSEAPR